MLYLSHKLACGVVEFISDNYSDQDQANYPKRDR